MKTKTKFNSNPQKWMFLPIRIRLFHCPAWVHPNVYMFVWNGPADICVDVVVACFFSLHYLHFQCLQVRHCYALIALCIEFSVFQIDHPLLTWSSPLHKICKIMDEAKQKSSFENTTRLKCCLKCTWWIVYIFGFSNYFSVSRYIISISTRRVTYYRLLFFFSLPFLCVSGLNLSLYFSHSECQYQYKQ